MAHFGMLQEHRDMLRKNRLFLLDEMNPEPVVQRLYQQNMMSQIVLESIQALPTRYEKNAALVNYLPKRGPKVFQLFCRALSASGQYPLRQKIQPEGVKWCVDLRTVITYDGKTLSLHKGTRSVPITLNQWNKLMTIHSRNTTKSGGRQKHQTASRGRSLCYNKRYSRYHVCGVPQVC